MENATGIAVWIIAVCAVIWTVRMLFTDWLTWMANRYRYTEAPDWAKALGKAVSGGTPR